MSAQAARRAAVALCAITSVSRADWTQFGLPDLASAWGPTALAHLSDGRYLFAQNGNYYRQDAWGAGAWSEYSGEAATDPSFIAIYDDTTAAAGQGGWSASDIDTFNPADLSDPAFTNIGLSLQNYHGVFRDDASLFTGGGDTGAGGDHHGIRYIALDGSLNKVVIDDVSTYSSGFDIDGAGNLYVSDNDDGSVYFFTKLQLDGAIAGSALSIADGTLVHNFGWGNVGTLAVDGLGRVWTTGFMNNGLTVYNPALDQEFSVVPNLANADYKVTTFEKDGEYYVAYLNQANAGQNNSAQYYGCDLAGNYAIPEPGTALLLGLGCLVAGCSGASAKRRLRIIDAQLQRR